VPGQVAAGRAKVTPITKTEQVPLAGARGGILAHDAVAPVDLSPFDNSAIDGYAMRHADL
jgi:molybdopterin molybdotransferase